jgi:hypothetical protein
LNIPNLDKENAVCVHIRQGDYINNHYVFFDRKEYFRTCLETMSKKISFEQLFVFSDDI